MCRVVHTSRLSCCWKVLVCDRFAEDTQRCVDEEQNALDEAVAEIERLRTLLKDKDAQTASMQPAVHEIAVQTESVEFANTPMDTNYEQELAKKLSRLSGEVQGLLQERDTMQKEIQTFKMQPRAERLRSLPTGERPLSTRSLKERPMQSPLPMKRPQQPMEGKAEPNDVADLGAYFDDLLRGSADHKQNDKARIYAVLNVHNAQIKLIYRWYMAHSMYRTERTSFHLSPNQFRLLIKHSKCSLDVSNEIGTILKQARQLRNAEGKITAEFEGIDLRGFVEALVRISDIQYRSLKAGLADKVARFFDANVPLLEQFRSDGFRDSVMSLDTIQV